MAMPDRKSAKWTGISKGKESGVGAGRNLRHPSTPGNGERERTTAPSPCTERATDAPRKLSREAPNPRNCNPLPNRLRLMQSCRGLAAQETESRFGNLTMVAHPPTAG